MRTKRSAKIALRVIVDVPNIYKFSNMYHVSLASISYQRVFDRVQFRSYSVLSLSCTDKQPLKQYKLSHAGYLTILTRITRKRLETRDGKSQSTNEINYNSAAGSLAD